jgi:predicted DNA-binding transcriptional regulator AlpA
MKAATESSRVLPPSLPPLGLRRVVAAEYVGVSPSLFEEMVRDGRMPQPKRVNSRVIWDRREIDLAFAALPSQAANDNNPWDEN